MKTPTRVLDVESNLTGEKVVMTIDNDAMSHVMQILTDLYSDPEMAVIREYATNARDAHVEAGVNLPIQVTLPSTLSPYLKIRDFGDGLGKKNAPKVNRGDVYRDRDPRRPRDLKVLAILGGMARVQNLETQKIAVIKASRLQSRFDRVRRGR